MTLLQDGQPKTSVETVVVWNGNGARARWADKAELKQVVQSVDPDVLCFLEGKTDAENLLRLPHFREWVAESRFRQMNCYWSLKDDRKALGTKDSYSLAKFHARSSMALGQDA